MVTIIKDLDNYVPVTVTELTTLSPVNYLMEFKNKETKVSDYCLLGTNLSDHTDRYDEFLVHETVSPNPLLSEVDLVKGQYIYNIYELTNDQVSALDFNNIDTSIYTVVEGNGEARVKGNPLVNTFYSPSTTNTTYEG